MPQEPSRWAPVWQHKSMSVSVQVLAFTHLSIWKGSTGDEPHGCAATRRTLQPRRPRGKLRAVLEDSSESALA